MPPPRSRRGPSVRAQTPKSSSPAAAETAAPQPQDAVEVVDVPAVSEPVLADEHAAAAPEANDEPAPSRRGRAASSRASAKKSEVKKVASERRPATPEEIAARRARIKTVLLIAGAVALSALVFVCMFVFVFRESEAMKKARSQFDIAERNYNNAVNALNNRLPAEVKQFANLALEAVDVAELNKGEGFSPNNKNSVDGDLEEQAKSIKEKAQRLLSTDLKQLEEELKVEANTRTLQADMQTLEVVTTDLDALASKVNAYINNPIDPSLGAVQDVSKYEVKINHARDYLTRIERQRKVRVQVEVDRPLEGLRSKVESLMVEHRYGAALEAVNETRKAAPKTEAGCAEVEARIKASAQRAWEAVEKNIAGRRAELALPSTEATVAAKLRATIRSDASKVVDTFGIDEWVSKAKAVLEQVPE